MVLYYYNTKQRIRRRRKKKKEERCCCWMFMTTTVLWQLIGASTRVTIRIPEIVGWWSWWFSIVYAVFFILLRQQDIIGSSSCDYYGSRGSGAGVTTTTTTTLVLALSTPRYHQRSCCRHDIVTCWPPLQGIRLRAATTTTTAIPRASITSTTISASLDKYYNAPIVESTFTNTNNNINPTCSTTSSSTQQQRQPPRILHLSLQWTDIEQQQYVHPKQLDAALSQPKFGTTSSRRYNTYYSKTVADIWRWKDRVLGDGRDYFLPKPQTLRALQTYLRNGCTDYFNNTATTTPPTILECVVLSNCARFEILLVYQGIIHQSTTSGSSANGSVTIQSTSHHDDDDDDLAVVRAISWLLLRQVQSDQKRQKEQIFPKLLLTSTMDWPADIDLNAHLLSSSSNGNVDSDDQEPMQDIMSHWTLLSKPHDICHHLCTVAAGMASRPRRPDRVVQFRPFSSRDAHILCQLKRTLQFTEQQEAQQQKHQQQKDDGLGVTRLLLRSALQAGKAARNPNHVPVLNDLRMQYGETGNSKKYDMEPPIHVMQRVQEAVIDLAIVPVVQDCAERLERILSVHESDDEYGKSRASIALFRQRILDQVQLFIQTESDRRYVLSQLHTPTVQLRQRSGDGSGVNETQIVQTLTQSLLHKRQLASV